MKVAARLVLVVLGLLLIGGGLYLLAVSLNMVGGGIGENLVASFGELVIGAAGAGLLLIALILFTLAFRSPKQKTAETVLQVNELGEIRIAIVAMENMVLRVVQRTQGAKDVSRRVTYTPQGLSVYIRVRVAPDLQIPALISELQAEVKNYLEEITGFVVHEIKATVENIIMDQVALKIK